MLQLDTNVYVIVFSIFVIDKCLLLYYLKSLWLYTGLRNFTNFIE